MAFFSDLSKKISQTGQEVVQKAKDTSETYKLDSMISDENKKINSLYQEIGKLYYEMYAESYDEAFTNIIFQINDCKNKINQYEEQVNSLKGVKKCPQCGTEIPYTAKFCNSCGLNLEAKKIVSEAPVTERHCPNCNSVTEEGSSFCENCGTPIVPEKVEISGNNIPEDTPAINTKCTNCGEDLGDAAFCPNCGTKAENNNSEG